MFEINNDRPVVNVFITKEYDKFKGTEDNRTTLDCTIDDLRKDPDRRKLIEAEKERLIRENEALLKNYYAKGYYKTLKTLNH